MSALDPAPLIATAHGLGLAAEKVGVILAALLAATFVLACPPRVPAAARALALLATVALTPLLLVVDIWNTSQLRHLRHHPAEAGAAIVLGVLVVVALAELLRRRPLALAPLAVAALPFRLPISTAPGTTNNLLIPLYLVVGAAALAYALPVLAATLARPNDRPKPHNPGDHDDHTAANEHTAPADPPPGRLEWLLLASVVLYALQSVYSTDFGKALESVVFFYVPFALLFAMLRRLNWNRELLVTCLGVAVIEAVLFAGIGFVEYADKRVLLNSAVVAANQYDTYFRVNSLFFDPSIYGRFLALVMLAVTTVVLWTSRRRNVVVGGGVLLWLLAGVITSFSQSSLAALLTGLAVLAAWRWNVRDTLLTCLGLLAAALVVVLLAPASSHLGLNGARSTNNATNGRTSLIDNGASLFSERPIEGYGSGSFALEYQRHDRLADEGVATSASHTIPITVAAEQGLIGLALYVALLLVAFWRLFAGAGRDPARIAIAACFAALVLHTMVYADFLEDPITWTLLAIGAALALAADRDREAGTVAPAVPWRTAPAWLRLRGAQVPAEPVASAATPHPAAAH